MGNSSMARTTGLSTAARAVKTSSPRRSQVPLSIPDRSLTFRSAASTASMRSPTPCRKLAKPDLMRSQAVEIERAAKAISATASAGVPAASRSTNRVSWPPSAFSRRSSSLTKLVLPIRRWAVSSVWVPSPTRSFSASISASRSKNWSPSTQLEGCFLSRVVKRAASLASIRL